jgi:hypothetical protein
MACECCVGKNGEIGAPFKGNSPKSPKELWPENFVEEFEGRGTYYCPACRDGLDAARAKQADLKEHIHNSKLEILPIAPPAVEVVKELTSSESTYSVWWIIGLAVYICSIFWVWTENAIAGRWMLLATPLIFLIGAAYYFAEGKTQENRLKHFVANLQKIGLCIIALWLLAKCSGGSGDGPIDTYFRR